jgi:hypothetical protein
MNYHKQENQHETTYPSGFLAGLLLGSLLVQVVCCSLPRNQAKRHEPSLSEKGAN